MSNESPEIYGEGVTREAWLAELRRTEASDHPFYKRPRLTDALWRYMDFAKFVDMLEKRALYFSAAPYLGDEFEGSLSQATLDKAAETAAEVARQLAEMGGSGQQMPFRTYAEPMLEWERHWTFVSCWHANPTESAAMWKLYATSSQAVAIQTTYEALYEGLMHHRVPPAAEPLIACVRYIDYASEAVQTGMHLSPFFHKRSSFKHEEEVRAVIQELPLIPIEWASNGSVTASRYDLAAIPPLGKLLDIDLDRVITAVRVAPEAPSWIRELTASVCRRYGLKQVTEASVLDDRPIY